MEQSHGASGPLTITGIAAGVSRPHWPERSGMRELVSAAIANNAFECLDLIGWEQAGDVVPTVVGQMVAARGAKESTAWRQPEDLVTLCQATAAEVPSLFAASRGKGRWFDHAALAPAPRRRCGCERKGLLIVPLS